MSFVAGVLALTACLNKIPPQRLEQPAPIAVAIVLEGGDAVPESFQKRIYDVLASRNLEPKEMPASALGGQKLSPERFQALRTAAPDVPFALLVEARAQFFAQVNGRFRWTVSVKFTAGREGSTATPQDQADFPALLQFEHEKAEEALDDVGDFVASRLGPLIDGLLVGVNNPAAPAAPAPAADAGVTLRPSGDSIYFVMVDRFANGDPSNDRDVDVADPAAFHGGDLAGVRAHLDWLQSLGVGTVWLSPVFALRAEKLGQWGAYHGYWVERADRLEPRFGSEAELIALRDALAARGMGLMLDVVLNHVGPDTELTRTHPDWFHHRGRITDWHDPEQLVSGEVQGLPDLDESNPEVYAFLRDAALKWQREVRPAGFRLDAVKHMPSAFWRRLNGELAHAGGPAFMLLGEMLDGDAPAVAQAWRDGGFTTMFDFPLRFAMIDVLCKGQSPAKLGAVLTDDRLYPDPAKLVTLLDNHDLPRLASECPDHREAALQLLYAMRGTPSLSWGTEVGLEGQRDPDNRASMRFDETAELKGVIARAAAMRAAHPSLTEGALAITAASASHLTLERIADRELATIEVDGQRVQVAFRRGDFRARAAAARQQWREGSRRRRVDFAGPKDALVVGSGPELGGWDQARALKLPASAELPVGGVFELKLVSNERALEAGPNRVLFVADEAGPLEVALAWRGS